MSLAVLSLLALAAAILVSCFTPINVGFLSIALAFVIGFFPGEMKVAEIVQGFPINLFLTLAGITLLFSQARVNGTLDADRGRRPVQDRRGDGSVRVRRDPPFSTPRTKRPRCGRCRGG